MIRQDELSDGEFWDIGEDRKIPHRRKQIAKGNTSFPSLSVYISCQEEAAKDDSGNTVSISIPDIANVSQLRIDQIDTDDNHKTTKIRSQPKQDKIISLEDQPPTEDEKGVATKRKEAREDLEEVSRDYSEDEAEDDFGEILFFDNSEPKTLTTKVRKSEKLKHSRSKQIRQISYLDAEKLLTSGQYPPHQLLKHWLYRGRKLLSAGDGHMAVDAFIRSYALARIVHGTSHWRTARCKVFLARSYFYLLNFSPQAITHINEANEVITTCLSSSVDVIKKPQIHHTLAWSHLIEGEAKISLKMYRQAFPSLSRSLYHTKQFTVLIARRNG